MLIGKNDLEECSRMEIEALLETIDKQYKIIVSQRQEIEMYKEINKSIHKEYKKKAQIVFNEIVSQIGKR